MDNFLRLTVKSTRYMIAWWDTLASRNYQIPCIIAHPCMSISGHLHFARRLHTLPTSGFVHCACPISIVHLIFYLLRHTRRKTDGSSQLPKFGNHTWQPNSPTKMFCWKRKMRVGSNGPSGTFMIIHYDGSTATQMHCKWPCVLSCNSSNHQCSNGTLRHL